MKTKVKSTNKDMLIMRNYIIGFLNKFSEGERSAANVRLGKRTINGTNGVLEDYREALEDIQDDNCVYGERGEILIVNGERQLSRENKKKLKEARKKLDAIEIEYNLIKVDWSSFNKEEQEYFALDDEDTYKICNLFINELPEFIED